MRQLQLCQGGKASGLCDVSVQAAGRARQPVGCAVSPAASDLCSLAPGIQLWERRECTGRGSSLPAPRLGLRWGCAGAALPPGCEVITQPGLARGDAASLMASAAASGTDRRILEPRVQRAVLERHFWLGSRGDVALLP